jgi:hypothetical protein
VQWCHVLECRFQKVKYKAVAQGFRVESFWILRFTTISPALGAYNVEVDLVTEKATVSEAWDSSTTDFKSKVCENYSSILPHCGNYIDHRRGINYRTIQVFDEDSQGNIVYQYS